MQCRCCSFSYALQTLFVCFKRLLAGDVSSIRHFLPSAFKIKATTKKDGWNSTHKTTHGYKFSMGRLSLLTTRYALSSCCLRRLFHVRAMVVQACHSPLARQRSLSHRYCAILLHQQKPHFSHCCQLVFTPNHANKVQGHLPRQAHGYWAPFGLLDTRVPGAPLLTVGCHRRHAPGSNGCAGIRIVAQVIHTVQEPSSVVEPPLVAWWCTSFVLFFAMHMSCTQLEVMQNVLHACVTVSLVMASCIRLEKCHRSRVVINHEMATVDAVVGALWCML